MVTLKDLKGKEGLDYDSLNFKDSFIEIVEIKDYSKNDKEEQKRVIIQTAKLVEGRNIRGTTFITLFRDEEGNLCYSTSPNSKASKMLKFFGVDNFEDLKGKPCKVVVKLDNNFKKKVEIWFGD